MYNKTHTYTHTYIYTYLYAYEEEEKGVLSRVCNSIYVHYVCWNIHVYTYLCINVCMYLYIHTCIEEKEDGLESRGHLHICALCILDHIHTYINT